MNPTNNGTDGQGNVDGQPYRRSEGGNAIRFADQHRIDIRYCYPWKRWLVWDGNRWALDDGNLIEALGKSTVKSLYQEALDGPDASRREEIEFATYSDRRASIRNMIELARSEPGIPIDPSELDQHKYLFNCLNGTVDLRTGELLQHDRDHLLTQLCHIKFDQSAKCPAWEQFLNEIMSGDVELIEYLRRLVGYSLTGDVSEQILPILHGSGANGKSTFCGTILAVMGADYALKAPQGFMMNTGERHPTEIADLFGKRLCVTSETDDGHRLSESLVKDLTGGDQIRARRMYQDHWSFEPTHKVWLATNYRPEIVGTDHAIWRRVRLIPFNVTIGEQQRDPHLGEKLRCEVPGILSWAVQGCRDWLANGLQCPSQVTAATGAYRSDQDVVQRFVDEMCIVEPGVTVKASEIWQAFNRCRSEYGDRRLSQRRFGAELERVISKRHSSFGRYKSNGSWYQGIGMINTRTIDE